MVLGGGLRFFSVWKRQTSTSSDPSRTANNRPAAYCVRRFPAALVLAAVQRAQVNLIHSGRVAVRVSRNKKCFPSGRKEGQRSEMLLDDTETLVTGLGSQLPEPWRAALRARARTRSRRPGSRTAVGRASQIGVGESPFRSVRHSLPCMKNATAAPSGDQKGRRRCRCRAQAWHRRRLLSLLVTRRDCGGVFHAGQTVANRSERETRPLRSVTRRKPAAVRGVAAG